MAWLMQGKLNKGWVVGGLGDWGFFLSRPFSPCHLPSPFLGLWFPRQSLLVLLPLAGFAGSGGGQTLRWVSPDASPGRRL